MVPAKVETQSVGKNRQPKLTFADTDREKLLFECFAIGILIYP